MNRKPNHPDLQNPPYCKAVIEYIEDGKHQTKVVKGFLNIQYLHPHERPNRLSVLYSDHQDWIPEDAEWVGDQPEGAEKTYELVFYEARIKQIVFEEEWDYEADLDETDLTSD